MVVIIVRYLLLGLAVLLLIGSIIMLLRSLRLRTTSRSETYNVLRLNQRRGMVNQAFGSVGLLLLALIFFAVGGFMFTGGDAAGEESAQFEIPTPPSSSTMVSVTSTPLAAAIVGTATPDLGSEPAAPTADSTISAGEPSAPTVEPTSTLPVTATPVPALVNSPVVGLYLRTGPGGDIIERLEDQVEVALLGEEQTADGFTWVLVSAPSGNEGWVAIDFLLVGQTVDDIVPATETSTPDSEGDENSTTDG